MSIKTTQIMECDHAEGMCEESLSSSHAASSLLDLGFQEGWQITSVDRPGNLGKKNLKTYCPSHHVANPCEGKAAMPLREGALQTQHAAEPQIS